jgi:hypothetical protein
MSNTSARRCAAVTAVAALLAFSAAAQANNDPVSVGDNCSGNPKAIGQPGVFGTVNATDIVDVLHPDHANPVDGPASVNNPGESTGARAQDRLTGTGICGL